MENLRIETYNQRALCFIIKDVNLNVKNARRGVLYAKC